jgi:cytochrome c biogenesis protein CcdA
MKLTAEQIDQLYQFTRQHYVEYYDLQTELVDHLANAIEAEWETNPELSFDEVLNQEFKKFGVFGFMDVVEKRQEALNKRYNKIVWQHFKAFFGIPKIVLTVAMTVLLFTVLKISLYEDRIIIGLYLILISFTFYEMIKSRKQRNQKEKLQEKKWLFEEIINQYGTFSGAILLPFNILLQLFDPIDSFLTNDYFLLGISVVFVLFSIALFIIFKIIPSKAEAYLKQTYPEYKLENL